MRVLVTGSRDWEDRMAIRDAFADVYRDHGPFALLHGACPAGADAIADDIYRRGGLGPEPERYPADWNRYGKRAGFLRNKAMIDTRPDLVLAFVRNESRGATMTISLAEAAGIPVTICRETR